MSTNGEDQPGGESSSGNGINENPSSQLHASAPNPNHTLVAPIPPVNMFPAGTQPMFYPPVNMYPQYTFQNPGNGIHPGPYFYGMQQQTMPPGNTKSTPKASTSTQPSSS